MKIIDRFYIVQVANTKIRPGENAKRSQKEYLKKLSLEALIIPNHTPVTMEFGMSPKNDDAGRPFGSVSG